MFSESTSSISKFSVETRALLQEVISSMFPSFSNDSNDCGTYKFTKRIQRSASREKQQRKWIMQVRVISTSCRQGLISVVAEVSDPEVIELNSVTICSIKPMFSTLKVSVSLKSLGRPKRDFIAATFFESKLEKIRKLD